jgi:hypothetical protein
LNDDRRRGRVCAFVTTAQNDLGDLHDALASGTRALAVAERLGDLGFRIVTTTYLGETHYYRGEYGRAVELTTHNLAALPADGVFDYFGSAIPPSVFDRASLVMSLAQLGRFGEATAHAAEALRLAESTQHAYTVGWAHQAAGTLRLLNGDWPKARILIDHWLARSADRERRLSAARRGHRLRLGLRPTRRDERGAEPAPGERAAPRASRDERPRWVSRVGLPRARSRSPAARSAR